MTSFNRREAMKVSVSAVVILVLFAVGTLFSFDVPFSLKNLKTTSESQESTYIPNQYLVKFEESVSFEEALNAIEKYDGVLLFNVDDFMPGYVIPVAIPDARAKQLEKGRGVEWVLQDVQGTLPQELIQPEPTIHVLFIDSGVPSPETQAYYGLDAYSISGPIDQINHGDDTIPEFILATDLPPENLKMTVISALESGTTGISIAGVLGALSKGVELNPDLVVAEAQHSLPSDSSTELYQLIIFDIYTRYVSENPNILFVIPEGNVLGGSSLSPDRPQNLWTALYRPLDNVIGVGALDQEKEVVSWSGGLLENPILTHRYFALHLFDEPFFTPGGGLDYVVYNSAGGTSIAGARVAGKFAGMIGDHKLGDCPGCDTNGDGFLSPEEANAEMERRIYDGEILDTVPYSVIAGVTEAQEHLEASGGTLITNEQVFPGTESKPVSVLGTLAFLQDYYKGSLSADLQATFDSLTQDQQDGLLRAVGGPLDQESFQEALQYIQAEGAIDAPTGPEATADLLSSLLSSVVSRVLEPATLEQIHPGLSLFQMQNNDYVDSDKTVRPPLTREQIEDLIAPIVIRTTATLTPDGLERVLEEVAEHGEKLNISRVTLYLLDLPGVSSLLTAPYGLLLDRAKELPLCNATCVDSKLPNEPPPISPSSGSDVSDPAEEISQAYLVGKLTSLDFTEIGGMLFYDTPPRHTPTLEERVYSAEVYYDRLTSYLAFDYVPDSFRAELPIREQQLADLKTAYSDVQYTQALYDAAIIDGEGVDEALTSLTLAETQFDNVENELYAPLSTDSVLITNTLSSDNIPEGESFIVSLSFPELDDEGVQLHSAESGLTLEQQRAADLFRSQYPEFSSYDFSKTFGENVQIGLLTLEGVSPVDPSVPLIEQQLFVNGTLFNEALDYVAGLAGALNEHFADEGMGVGTFPGTQEDLDNAAKALGLGTAKSAGVTSQLRYLALRLPDSITLDSSPDEVAETIVNMKAQLAEDIINGFSTTCTAATKCNPEILYKAILHLDLLGDTPEESAEKFLGFLKLVAPVQKQAEQEPSFAEYPDLGFEIPDFYQPSPSSPADVLLQITTEEDVRQLEEIIDALLISSEISVVAFAGHSGEEGDTGFEGEREKLQALMSVIEIDKSSSAITYFDPYSDTTPYLLDFPFERALARLEGAGAADGLAVEFHMDQAIPESEPRVYYDPQAGTQSVAERLAAMIGGKAVATSDLLSPDGTPRDLSLFRDPETVKALLVELNPDMDLSDIGPKLSAALAEVAEEWKLRDAIAESSPFIAVSEEVRSITPSYESVRSLLSGETVPVEIGDEIYDIPVEDLGDIYGSPSLFPSPANPIFASEQVYWLRLTELEGALETLQRPDLISANEYEVAANIVREFQNDYSGIPSNLLDLPPELPPTSFPDDPFADVTLEPSETPPFPGTITFKLLEEVGEEIIPFLLGIRSELEILKLKYGSLFPSSPSPVSMQEPRKLSTGEAIQSVEADIRAIQFYLNAAQRQGLAVEGGLVDPSAVDENYKLASQSIERALDTIENLAESPGELEDYKGALERYREMIPIASRTDTEGAQPSEKVLLTIDGVTTLVDVEDISDIYGSPLLTIGSPTSRQTQWAVADGISYAQDYFERAEEAANIVEAVNYYNRAEQLAREAYSMAVASGLPGYADTAADILVDIGDAYEDAKSVAEPADSLALYFLSPIPPDSLKSIEQIAAELTEFDYGVVAPPSSYVDPSDEAPLYFADDPDVMADFENDVILSNLFKKLELTPEQETALYDAWAETAAYLKEATASSESVAQSDPSKADVVTSPLGTFGSTPTAEEVMAHFGGVPTPSQLADYLGVPAPPTFSTTFGVGYLSAYGPGLPSDVDLVPAALQHKGFTSITGSLQNLIDFYTSPSYPLTIAPVQVLNPTAVPTSATFHTFSSSLGLSPQAVTRGGTLEESTGWASLQTGLSFSELAERHQQAISDALDVNNATRSTSGLIGAAVVAGSITTAEATAAVAQMTNEAFGSSISVPEDPNSLTEEQVLALQAQIDAVRKANLTYSILTAQQFQAAYYGFTAPGVQTSEFNAVQIGIGNYSGLSAEDFMAVANKSIQELSLLGVSPSEVTAAGAHLAEESAEEAQEAAAEGDIAGAIEAADEALGIAQAVSSVSERSGMPAEENPDNVTATQAAIEAAQAVEQTGQAPEDPVMGEDSIDENTMVDPGQPGPDVEGGSGDGTGTTGGCCADDPDAGSPSVDIGGGETVDDSNFGGFDGGDAGGDGGGGGGDAGGESGDATGGCCSGGY